MSSREECSFHFSNFVIIGLSANCSLDIIWFLIALPEVDLSTSEANPFDIYHILDV